MSNLQTALSLARLGYYVHPLVPRDKMPLAGGNGSNDATRDESTIREWWDATPSANVGISLDKSGLVDIAPDCPEWAERFRENGMPHTTAYTSGGGAGHWHTLYRLPSGGPLARSCVPQQYDIMSQGNTVAPGSTHPSGRTYDLQTELLPVKSLPLAPAWAIDILQARTQPTAPPSAVAQDWSAAERWLGNIGALLNAQGLPKRIQPKSQTGQIIRAGGLAEDRSLARYIVARGLIMHGYPDDEIAALLWWYCDYGHTAEKGSRWLQADISRIIAKERAKLPSIVPSPTRVASALDQAAPIVEVARPKIGRKIALTPAQLLAFYEREMHASDVVLLTVKDVAAQLGVSRSTIERCERALRAEGLIERRDFNRRQSSLVAILRPVKTPQPHSNATADHVPSDSTPVLMGKPEIAIGSIHGGTHPPEGVSALGAPAGSGPWPAMWHAKDVDRPGEVLGVAGVWSDGQVYVWFAGADGGKTGVPLDEIEFDQIAAPEVVLGPPARITIAVTTPRHARADALIYEAIVAIDTQQPREELDRKTGELRSIKPRVTKQRVERYLKEQHRVYVVPNVLDELYPEQLLKRTRERKIAALAELTPAGLRAELRLAEHMAEKCKEYEEPVARWWKFYGDMARKEQARRPADSSRPAGGLVNCEALPDMRAAGGRRQAELCDVADDALLTMRAQRQGRAPSGGVCSPQPRAPAGAAPAGLVERLQLLKAQRDVAVVGGGT